MSLPLSIRCQHMVLGAMVADAAALGLHWIYDQAHIRKIAPDAPEFHPLDENDYKGVMGYYAHADRDVGAQSQYGIQALVMVRSLSQTGGVFDAAHFAAEFRKEFGYGGSYVGYIDHATRDTLDNYRRYCDAIQEKAQTLPFSGNERVRKAIVQLVQSYRIEAAAQANPAGFAQVLQSAGHSGAALEFGLSALDAVRVIDLPTGADDLQLPAIAKLPPLVAQLCISKPENKHHFEDTITDAVRTTSDNTTAIEYSLISAAMMRAALQAQTLDAVLSSAVDAAAGETRTRLTEACALRSKDNSEVTAQFGMACDLPFGVPSAIHNIATASSFAQGVRANIYAGGDSCGRAMLVGAVLGALYGLDGEKGIPSGWLEKLECGAQAKTFMTTLWQP